MLGSVAWFDLKRGYGFIKPQEGADVFVHIRELESCGIGGLKQGDVVDFEITQGRNGRTCARRVKFLKPAHRVAQDGFQDAESCVNA